MRRRLDLINSIADTAYAAMYVGDRENARWTLEFKFDPALVDATTSMNRLIDILGGQNKLTMEAAADSKAWTYKVILVMLIGGTLITLLAAMLLAHRTVARPLQRLAGVMRQIAQGQFDAQIEGLQRSDEVGTMRARCWCFAQRRRTARGAGAAGERARAGRRRQARGDRAVCPQFREPDPERGRGAGAFRRRARSVAVR